MILNVNRQYNMSLYYETKGNSMSEGWMGIFICADKICTFSNTMVEMSGFLLETGDWEH